MKRFINTKTLKTTKGSDVRGEQDVAGHLFRTCSGCETEQYHAGMAGVLKDVVDHAHTCGK
ncbi:hypothetical protein [Streptomyces sp. MP131-18]|uniref:hypothetical protein n=1 Tax=Streptomyces sp. MP131-18 TaxID=1857892 RepID=UPI00097C1470|nr:hypothetical protein [Streptomyces sp. MP131-18]ONK09273.1 hypothetical protein STBA_71280 [Streptomyces sp. MP131-18]